MLVGAHVAQAAVVPPPGQELPRSATVTGPCTPAAPFPILPADPPLGLPYHGDEVYTRIGFVDPGGSGPLWGYIRPGPDPGGGGVCPSGDDAEVTVSRPGPWRMEVVNHMWDLSWGGWGWVTDSDSERLMQSVDFRVVAKSCTGDKNAVKSVYTPSGSDLGLPGTQIFPG